MLFPVVPPANILHIAVNPNEGSLPLLYIVNVLALIPLGIAPLVDSISVHLVVYPRACVFPTVCPNECALTIQQIQPYLAFVAAAIRPFELSVAVLVALVEGALEGRSILPYLLTFAML